jgi:YVTN family beta-propeller protein
LCYNPTNNKVYCANCGSGSVTVIDGATDSVIATVSAGTHLYALCYNPTDNKVYCANRNNYSSDDVIVIDCGTDSVIATVPAGTHPYALCYNPTNNKVYCANNGDSSVTVIDGTTNGVVATIGVGSSPRALAWNPVQNRVYVANYGSSSISVLRDSGGAAIQESFKPQAASPKPLPTIVRGVLFLPRAENGDSPTERSARGTVPIFHAMLLDIGGRKVLDLHPGANDVRALAPGVYFVREEPQATSAKSQAIRKVVLTR